MRWEGKGRKRRGKYLCPTCSILCGTAGYELCVAVLKQVFVKAHVLVFGEYGVVGLETVLREHCFIATHK